jgi:hypothetical protein
MTSKQVVPVVPVLTRDATKNARELAEIVSHRLHQLAVPKKRMDTTGRISAVIEYKDASWFQRWFNHAEPPCKDFSLLPFGIIHPQSYFMTVWEFFNILMIIGCTILVPMELGFDLPGNLFMTIISGIIDIFFLVDIFFTFRCAYFSDHVLITDQGQISCRYLRFWFWIDFCGASAGTVSYILGDAQFSSLTTIKLLRIARCFKIIRLAHVQELLNHLDKLGPEMFFLVRFTKILTMAVLCVHFIACGWWGIAQYAADGAVSWADTDGVLQSHVPDDPSYSLYSGGAGTRGDFRRAPLLIKYSCAVYWAFVTVSTVGYGDINPVSMEERMFAVVCCFIGTTVFAFVISEISKVSSGKSYMDGEIKRRRDELEYFIEHFRLPPALKKEVRAYYSKQGALLCVDQHSILRDLNRDLKDKLSQFLMRDVLLQVPLFSQVTSRSIYSTVYEN